MNTMAPLRAGTYSRQSEDVSAGIETQRKLNREAVERRGWELVTEYVDNDVSASKARGMKTDWARMLRDLEAGYVQVIVATDQDRIVRSPKDLLELIDRKAKLVTLNGEIDLTSSEGELHATMMAAWARAEVRRKAERQRRANKARAEKGKPGGIWVPFGYAADKVTIVPEQAAAIRNGAEMYLAGANRGEIARAWNDAGFRTSQGNLFNALAVKVVLTNPRYVGMRTYQGDVIGEGNWESIMDQETFDAIQRKVENGKYSTTPMTVSRHMLVGSGVCADCGLVLRIGYTGKKSNTRIYRCPVGHVSRPANSMEDFVSGAVIERLSAPDAHDLLLTHDVESLALLRDEAQELRGRQSHLTVQFSLGNIPADALAAGMAIVKQRLAEVEETLTMAGRMDVLAPLVLAPDVEEAWDQLPMERKRVVIAKLLTLTLHKAGRGYRGPTTNQLVNITWLQ